MVVSKSGNPGPGPVPKTRAQIRLLLTWKTYIADISYKNFFFLHLFKKCDKIHNFMHYVKILLKLMP
jgi:hypothetical protein